MRKRFVLGARFHVGQRVCDLEPKRADDRVEPRERGRLQRGVGLGQQGQQAGGRRGLGDGGHGGAWARRGWTKQEKKERRE